MAVFVSSSSVCGLIVFFSVSHVLACLLIACMSPLCLRVVSLHPRTLQFICISFPLVCTLCVVDAHKPPSSYGTHVARWCGASIVLFFFVSAARLLLVFAPFHLPWCWSAHKSLAPRARTLLGGLGHATLSFFAVATLLFVFFCECPKFCDLAKQRRKILGGFLRSERTIFRFIFSGGASFSWFFIFFLLRSRDFFSKRVKEGREPTCHPVAGLYNPARYTRSPAVTHRELPVPLLTCPPRMYVMHDFVSMELEARLVALAREQTHYNRFTRRREAQYGSQYKKGRVIPLCPLHDAAPGLVLRLAEDISELLGAEMKQAIINKYTRGRGTGPHIDLLLFGDWVCIVSLLRDVWLRFRHATYGECPVYLPRLSLFAMVGEARCESQHYIRDEDMDGERWSFTFRG